MSLPLLPTAWNLYNLASSPYFQGTLERREPSQRPLSLFVGRERELKRLRARVHGAGNGSSRQAVAGMPGVGKTTLVQELKSLLLSDGYLATDEVVPILPRNTPDQLFGRVLAALYDTVLVNRPHTRDNAAMRDAQLLVRAMRIGTGGGSVSAFGFGWGVSKGAAAVTPKDMLIDGPRIMRDLMALVQSSDARGVVLHLNNLENLTESDARHAAELLRSLRDLMLLHDGLHLVLVGTTAAVQAIVQPHAQVRSIVDTLLIGPLTIAEVHRLLAARAQHLRLDPKRPVVPPVDDESVSALYELYRGDLRGLLKALDDGVGQLIGIEGLRRSTGRGSTAAVRPLTIDELRPTLHDRYLAELLQLPDRARVEQLTRWGETAPARAMTQKSLTRLWKISQGAVSAALAWFVERGFVVALPRKGTQPIDYVLSGSSRLMFPVAVPSTRRRTRP